MTIHPQKWTAQAPSNIALIKYMGKTCHHNNTASNCSLSYTLPALTSTVEISILNGIQDVWAPLDQHITLSSQGQTRFLNHLAQIKTQFNYQGALQVRSCNNFPQDCGLASSASSFAALTLCANTALSELTGQTPLSQNVLAALSRSGSGSSCRSLFSPWCQWDGDKIEPITTLQAPHPYHHLLHQVVIVNQQHKKVSSSQAHQRVVSSLLFADRQERARTRQTALLNALIKQQWRSCFELAWQDFWDMHALFTTASPPFDYITPDTLWVLQQINDFWEQQGDGPIATLDAGPNVHLLWRSNQTEQAKQLHDIIEPRYDIR